MGVPQRTQKLFGSTEVHRVTSSLPIRDGAEVLCGDRRFVIRQVLGFDTVVAEDAETGRPERLAIAEIRAMRQRTGLGARPQSGGTGRSRLGGSAPPARAQSSPSEPVPATAT